MGLIQNEFDEFMVLASRAIRDVKHGLHLASWHHIILLSVGVLFCIAGMSTQILSLNFWLAHFPADVNGWPAGGPVPVLILASIFINVAYGVVLGIWLLRKKPSLASLKNPSVWMHGVCGGACLAGNGIFVVFATPHVPEVTQSVLVASQILWTFIFAVVFKINHGKNYCHVLVIVALLLSLGGIGLGTAATESGDSTHFKDVGIWSFIFAMGILPGAITNVIAASFMQNCAYDDKADDPVVVVEEEKHWIQSHPDLAAALEADEEKRHLLPDNHHNLSTPSGMEPNRKSSGNSNSELMSGYGGSRSQLGGVNASNAQISSNNSNAHQQSGSGLKEPLVQRDSGLESSSMATHPHNQSRDSLSGANNNNQGDNNQNNSGVSLQISGKNKNNNNNNNTRSSKNDRKSLNDGSNKEHDIHHHRRKRMTANEKYERIDAETGKLVFLLQSSFFMLLFILALFPLDFVPFLGTNPGNATASVHSLSNGLLCVFDSLHGSNTEDCSMNGLYFALFGLAFGLTNAGQVIVSQFSAPLTAMVSQIASPVTAIILVILPSWSPQPQNANVLMAVFAALVIVIGSVIFAFWEQMTSQRQREEQSNPYAPEDEEETERDDETDYVSNKASSKDFRQNKDKNSGGDNDEKFSQPDPDDGVYGSMD